MWKQKIAIGTSKSFGIDVLEQINIFSKIGFEGIFFNWEENTPIAEWIAEARRSDMFVQSIHAPFKKSADFWHGDNDAAQRAIEEQKACINDCAQYGIKIMVVHAFIGFKDHSPNEIGIKRFTEVVDYAEENGVKIAFENTEGEEYLAALMNEFVNRDSVGFCWDSGHEMCYNRSKDMLALYGNKLIATHINDNLGIKDYSGEITYLDDLHLLPFDGIADWDYNVKRLKKYGCPEYLTFELTTLSKKDRFDNDIYSKMEITDYLCECYKRACKLAAKIAL